MTRHPAKRSLFYHCSRRGMAAVEFAVVLPLLMTLILGGLDFGRFAQTHIAVTNAARVGADVATMHPPTPVTLDLMKATIRQAVEEELAHLNGFSPANLAVVVTILNEGEYLWQAQVEVSYPFHTVIDWPGVPNTVNLSRVVVMRVIRP